MQPLRTKRFHLGEQLLSLQGAIEKLLPLKEAGEGTFSPGFSRDLHKAALDPSTQFSVAAGTAQGFLAKRLQEDTGQQPCS